MEFCENGDLQTFLTKRQNKLLSEQTIWKYFLQICLGVNYLHGIGIIHRDLKALNIFLCNSDRTVKIGDLGVARRTVDIIGSTPKAKKLHDTPVASKRNGVNLFENPSGT